MTHGPLENDQVHVGS